MVTEKGVPTWTKTRQSQTPRKVLVRFEISDNHTRGGLKYTVHLPKEFSFNNTCWVLEKEREGRIELFVSLTPKGKGWAEHKIQRNGKIGFNSRLPFAQKCSVKTVFGTVLKDGTLSIYVANVVDESFS